MIHLIGESKRIAFASPIMAGAEQYTGPLNWEVAGDDGVYLPVDPVNGATVAATVAAVDPNDGQALLITKVVDGVPFGVRATYPLTAGAGSITQAEMQFTWAAPQVFLNPFVIQPV